MSEMIRALQAFFAELGLPAYPVGQVPAGAALPLLTWEMAAGRFGAATSVTATAWFDGEGAHILRAAFLDDMLDAVPEAGARVPADHAVLLLERGGDFIAPVTDPAHPGLLGGRVRLTLRRYGAR